MKLPEHLKIFIFGSAVTITGNVVVGLVNYLVRRTLALNLSSSDYGSFYGTFALISILLAVFDFGLTDAGSVLVAEEKSRHSESFSVVFRLKGWLDWIADWVFFSVGIGLASVIWPDMAVGC